jgi:polyhydroxybutyrate depolymerase
MARVPPIRGAVLERPVFIGNQTGTTTAATSADATASARRNRIKTSGSACFRHLAGGILGTLLVVAGCLAASSASAAFGCPCSSGEVTVDGRARAYRVCAPAGTDAPLPVVMYLHDRDESAQRACRTTNWHETGFEAGFITVYLQGCDAAGAVCDGVKSYSWNDEAVDTGSAVDDVAYVRAVLAEVAADHRVDPSRVYAVGLGQGANMASLLACRAADLFAAVAPVNGAAKFSECATGGPLSVFPVNGDRDQAAPWPGCCEAGAGDPRRSSYVAGCEDLPVCGRGTGWSPPVLGGYHPAAAALGYDDLPGLEGIAEGVCSTDAGPFAPRPCPQDVDPGQGSCYGVEDCSIGPEPVRSEVLGLRLAGGYHTWQRLDDVIDLNNYLWARLSTATKQPTAPVCDDAIADVYATPLAAAEGVPPGTILRCAPLPPLSALELSWTLAWGAPGVEVLTGVSRNLVSYRTAVVSGEPAVGSAVILLPDQPAPGPLPVIVAGHGSAGVADACAPSTTGGISLGLAWAATGYPTVMSDYAGLGTEGIQPTASLTAVALSQLDGARALIHAAPAGLLDGRVVLAGHSQGGAGALVAQGLARDYAPELDLAAVVAFGALYDPTHPLQPSLYPYANISGGGGVIRAIAAAAVYSAAAAVRGEDVAGDVFQPAIRDFAVNAVTGSCALEMTGLLACAPGAAQTLCGESGYVPPRTVGEMFTAETLDGFAACLGGPGVCTDEDRAIVDLTERAIPLDPQGADMLFLAGINDYIVLPINVACSLETVEQSFGLHPDVCVSSNGHFDIAQAQTAYQMEWVKAKLAGEAPPPCPEDLTLPACPFWR